MKKTVFALLIALGLWGCSAPSANTGTGSDSGAIQPAKGAPDFDLENIAGGTTKAAEFHGKVSVIDFWATWCQPCIVEIPKFNEMHDAYQGKDVQVFAVTIQSPHEDIAPKVKETGIKYPVLVGNDEVVDGFGGVWGYPTTFVVTKDWKIYKKYFGALPNKHDKIKQDIEKLLAEEPSATNRGRTAVTGVIAAFSR